MERILTAAALVLVMAGCGTSGKMKVQENPVNVGYGTVNKKDLTTAVAQVEMNQNEVATYSSVYDYLRGRVPGVMVTSDNRIIIRGIGTNSGQTDPLILVDGVQVTDISNLNPLDIQSVDIIKDGSSAIYGVQGANGVLIITTKR